MADFYTDFSGAAGTDLRDMGFTNLLPYGDPEAYRYMLDGAGHAYGMPLGMTHNQAKFTDTIQTATIFRKDDLAEPTLSISARVADELYKSSCVLVTIDSSSITLRTDYSTKGTYDRQLAVGETETITLRAEGDVFTVLRNGEQILGPTTITKYASGYCTFGTLVGVWNKQDNGLLFDSYEFTDLSAEPAAITGTLSIAMPAPAVVMAGSVDISGDLNVAMPAPVVDMAGSTDVTGTLDVAMPAPVVAMSGVAEALPDITGSLAILMPAPVVQMSGIVRTPGELLPEDVWAVELVEGVTAGQMLTELWRLAGLDASAPMTVTTRERVAGPIRLAIGGDGRTSSTITRQ
jgi:hypothetical protein